MSRLEEAAERIKIIECPTGELEYRVADILDDYEIANRNEVTINRDKSLDRNGAQAYYTNLSEDIGKSIVILATSGLDDYVAKVVDVYIK